MCMTNSPTNPNSAALALPPKAYCFEVKRKEASIQIERIVVWSERGPEAGGAHQVPSWRALDVHAMWPKV